MEDNEETQKCPNCNREIPTVNFMIHSVHCVRNIKICSVCKEPVPLSELDDHNDKLHQLIPCTQCEEMVHGTDMEDHIRDSCAFTLQPCRYCSLEVRRRDVPTHERYCGSRTEQCDECGQYVMIRYRTLHLESNHGFVRLREESPPLPPEDEHPRRPRFPPYVHVTDFVGPFVNREESLRRIAEWRSRQSNPQHAHEISNEALRQRIIASLSVNLPTADNRVRVEDAMRDLTPNERLIATLRGNPRGRYVSARDAMPRNPVHLDEIPGNAEWQDGMQLNAEWRDAISRDPELREAVLRDAAQRHGEARLQMFREAIGGDEVERNEVARDSVATDAVAENTPTLNAIASTSAATNAVASTSAATNAVASNSATTNAVASTSATPNAVASTSATPNAVASTSATPNAVASTSATPNAVASTSATPNAVASNIETSSTVSSNVTASSTVTSNALAQNDVQQNTVVPDAVTEEAKVGEQKAGEAKAGEAKVGKAKAGKTKAEKAKTGKAKAGKAKAEEAKAAEEPSKILEVGAALVRVTLGDKINCKDDMIQASRLRQPPGSRTHSNGRVILKRTNDQPQINTTVSSQDKVMKKLGTPGAVKKRPAPARPALAAAAAPPPPSSPNPRRDLSYFSALQQHRAEDRDRRERTAYNVSIGLPPVLDPAAKLEKLRKMDALHNRESTSQGARRRAQGRAPRAPPAPPAASARDNNNAPRAPPYGRIVPSVENEWGRLVDLEPMSSEEFMDRFNSLQLVDETPGGDGPDRYGDIRSSLRELRRGLNEVTAPYNNSASNNNNNNTNKNNNIESSIIDDILNSVEFDQACALPPCDADVLVPCEFCFRQLQASTILDHERECRHGITLEPGLTGAPSSPLTPSLSPRTLSPWSDDTIPVIPCEFCTKKLPLYLISEHQERCGRQSQLLYPD